ncbi:MAG: hypothetical protein AABY64_01045 [Bdellovibrionota bacterium]
MKNFWIQFFLAPLFFVISVTAFAEEESLDQKPNEPPYTNMDEMDLAAPQARPAPEGKQIAHPNAAKGLYLIDRGTGEYFYKVDVKTKKEKTMSLRIGSYEAPSITATTPTGTIGFQDIYKESAPAFFLYDYEWAPFERFRQLGIQVGTGLLFTQGNGILLSSTILEAKEKYTFIAIPLNLGLIFRFEFMSRQWVVPYASGGGTYFGLVETRDDGKDNKVIGSPAAYAAGGLLLNLSAFDKRTAFVFDREYGINNLWLAAEFRVFQSFSEDLDMSSNVINMGVTVDY